MDGKISGNFIEMPLASFIQLTMQFINATRYLENGGDMYALQQILGHTSLEMVKKYVHSTTRKIVPKFPEFSPLDNLLHA